AKDAAQQAHVCHVIAKKRIDGGDGVGPERRAKRGWMAGSVTIAVLVEQAMCQVVVNCGVELRHVAVGDGEIIDDTHEQREAEHAEGGSQRYQLLPQALIVFVPVPWARGPRAYLFDRGSEVHAILSRG